jgi:hypothetical protein
LSGIQALTVIFSYGRKIINKKLLDAMKLSNDKLFFVGCGGSI